MKHMTEEEAKTKWCPFANESGGEQAFGETTKVALSTACIGSLCMAWITTPRPAIEYDVSISAKEAAEKGWVKGNPPPKSEFLDMSKPENFETNGPARLHESGAWYLPVKETHPPKRGYCGLVGKACQN